MVKWGYVIKSANVNQNSDNAFVPKYNLNARDPRDTATVVEIRFLMKKGKKGKRKEKKSKCLRNAKPKPKTKTNAKNQTPIPTRNQNSKSRVHSTNLSMRLSHSFLSKTIFTVFGNPSRATNLFYLFRTSSL